MFDSQISSCAQVYTKRHYCVETHIRLQWSSGIFGTVGTLGSPLPVLSPSYLSPPLLFFPFLSLPSPPLSGGNNFNDFPENQLTIHFAFLCKPAWGDATVSWSPLS